MRARRARKAEQARTRKPSGIQLSYGRARAAVAVEFVALGLSDAEALTRASAALQAVLPAKQRARLERSTA